MGCTYETKYILPARLEFFPVQRFLSERHNIDNDANTKTRLAATMLDSQSGHYLETVRIFFSHMGRLSLSRRMLRFTPNRIPSQVATTTLSRTFFFIVKPITWLNTANWHQYGHFIIACINRISNTSTEYIQTATNIGSKFTTVCI